MPPRHRAPGPARRLPAVRAGHLLLVAALTCSAAAVLLGLSGTRPAAVAVAAAGLALALGGALGGRVQVLLRRGSGRPAR
ncbi:hypothetical protein [Kineococcus auxinigenes]|uniref:hypothetical protein n=1 Tax=unclassified Kineococcus TaxID=2621656 RepID=UPI003D7EEA33